MTVNRQLETLELKTHSTLLPRSSEYYLPNDHTVCDTGPFSARTYPDFPADRNASQKPQCTVTHVFEKLFYLTLFHHPTPHQAPTSALLSKISTCIWKAQSGKV